MQFGELLKTLRAQKGISIKKLAPEIGLDYTYISKLENSKVMPSEQVILKFSKYFDYSSDELMIAAGKLPDDVQAILKSNSKQILDYLRTSFNLKKNAT